MFIVYSTVIKTLWLVLSVFGILTDSSLLLVAPSSAQQEKNLIIWIWIQNNVDIFYKITSLKICAVRLTHYITSTKGTFRVKVIIELKLYIENTPWHLYDEEYHGWAHVALYTTASIQLLCLLSGFSVQNPSAVIWVKGRRTKYVLCQRRNSKIDTLLVLPLSDFVSLSVDVTLKMNKFSFSE